MNFSLETKQLNSILFEDIDMSTFFPEDRGDPSRQAVDTSVSGRTILCDLRISLDKPLAPMISHFDRFKKTQILSVFFPDQRNPLLLFLHNHQAGCRLGMRQQLFI